MLKGVKNSTTQSIHRSSHSNLALVLEGFKERFANLILWHSIMDMVCDSRIQTKPRKFLLPIPVLIYRLTIIINCPGPQQIENWIDRFIDLPASFLAEQGIRALLALRVFHKESLEHRNGEPTQVKGGIG